MAHTYISQWFNRWTAINATGMINEITLFTLIKHRINYTGLMIKWWWNGGVERGVNPNIERMLNVFDLLISTPEEKSVSGICASKTRRNFQIFGWCLQFKQSCPSAALSYFCLRKQIRENQYNRASRFKEKCLRKAQHYHSSLKEEKALCKFSSLTLPPKNHNLFCGIGSKREVGEKWEYVTTSS